MQIGRIRELFERISEYNLGASVRKDPVLCIGAAYRIAWRRAVGNGDFDRAVLITELKAWPIPGVYDDQETGPLAYVYRSWDARVPPRRFRHWLFRQPRQSVDPTIAKGEPPPGWSTGFS